MRSLFQRATTGITKNVVVISLVSFFNDIASEMIYPIVPIFLTTVLGAPVTVVGLIEGIAESTASILRVFSGWFSDKFQRRKPFMIAGYVLSSLSKLIMAVSVHWSMIMGGRFLDRFGKGVRTSARDALLTESCDASCRGRVFGFHRAIDTLGALVGPLAALVLLQVFSQNLRSIFFLSLIPAVIGVFLLAAFVKDISRKEVSINTVPIRLRDMKLSKDFKIFLIVSAIFAVGNSSDAFLILRAQDLGFSLGLTIVVYTAFNHLVPCRYSFRQDRTEKGPPLWILPFRGHLFSLRDCNEAGFTLGTFPTLWCIHGPYGRYRQGLHFSPYRQRLYRHHVWYLPDLDWHHDFLFFTHRRVSLEIYWSRRSIYFRRVNGSRSLYYFCPLFLT
jgi:MFS family permease